MSNSFFVFPTKFNSDITVAKAIAAMKDSASIYIAQDQELTFEKWDVISNPFRFIPFADDEEFIWNHHEVEEVNVLLKDQNNKNENIACIWNDNLSSSFVGTLDDFVPNSIPAEISEKIQDLNFHWRFEAYNESDSGINMQITIAIGIALAKLCDGIMMYDKAYQEYREEPLVYEGYIPLNPEEFLEYFFKTMPLN